MPPQKLLQSKWSEELIEVLISSIVMYVLANQGCATKRAPEEHATKRLQPAIPALWEIASYSDPLDNLQRTCE